MATPTDGAQAEWNRQCGRNVILIDKTIRPQFEVEVTLAISTMHIRNARDKKYPRDFPPQEYFVEESSVKDAVQLAFSELLNNRASETDADHFIQDHRAILGQCLNFTNFGHHGIWVIPQKLVDPGASPSRKGLKPDYVLGGKNSDGFFWCVVELKGTQDKLFKRANDDRRTISFSAVANEGICQLLQYMDYCNAAQAFFRDHFGLTDFREPRGFLVIGRESEFESDEQLQELKAAWNRVSGGKIMIRTYDALLRSDHTSWGEVEHGWYNDGHG